MKEKHTICLLVVANQASMLSKCETLITTTLTNFFNNALYKFFDMIFLLSRNWHELDSIHT